MKVKLVVNITKVHGSNPFVPIYFSSTLDLCLQPTAAGAVELRLICPPNIGNGMDVILPKYNAGLPAGVTEFDFEFTADSGGTWSSRHVIVFLDVIALSGTFGCDDGCPGTYNMKLSVCELECDDSKHAGHAGALR